MRLALAELAPRPGELAENLSRVATVASAANADVTVFPELFLSGYRVGDRFRHLAIRPGDAASGELARIARDTRTTLVVGAPVAAAERPGELYNAAIVVRPDGTTFAQRKRYLPTFGLFEEGVPFTPAAESEPTDVGGRRAGLQICYDVFFPEVSRDLALGGAELLIALSASPVTSRRLFERLLPARAIENGLSVVYVNRVGVEDGIVFGGGSGVWDPRGEPVDVRSVATPTWVAEESVVVAEVDPDASARWRPFRPVLRDLATRAPRPTGEAR